MDDFVNRDDVTCSI